jgi:hypothetical protein
MDRVAMEFAGSQRNWANREAADLRRWLGLRADDICGVAVARMGDLFGLEAAVPDWKSLQDPLDRLAAFAADAGNPTARRREANSVVALFRRRVDEQVSRMALSPSRLRPIGMLLLVPDGYRA